MSHGTPASNPLDGIDRPGRGRGEPDAEGLRERIAEGPQRFSTLPAPVAPDEVRTSTDVTPGPDSDGGRDPERDWMLRYGS
jgi:hypothetical protein